MDTRTITDNARDRWTVEVWPAEAGRGATLECRHELGYELVVRVRKPPSELDEAQLREVLERARRRGPGTRAA